jgi:hypothetical protein
LRGEVVEKLSRFSAREVHKACKRAFKMPASDIRA